ncbi:MAG: hypothetical protein G01um101456_738, partial [Parcubacteria group bacterium Gr01-1014_56]
QLRVFFGALVVVLIAALPARAAPVDDLVAKYLPWVAAQTHYKVNYVRVHVVFATAVALKAIAHSPGYKGQGEAASGTIGTTVFLPSTFQIGKNDDDLVHELVHVLQNANGATFSCWQSMEAEAYSLQDRFVEEFGIGEKTDYLYLWMISHCPNPYGLP